MTNDISASFRNKVVLMKSWKPTNSPSNRDRLELYALHKQAISGDAPDAIPSSIASVAAEKAKFNAWKSKKGVPTQQAMQLYLQESDRQVRVYGTNANQLENAKPEAKDSVSGVSSTANSNPQTPLNTPNHNSGKVDEGADDANNNNNPADSTNASSTTTTPSRGLAAVPLLCAAACEPRPGYIRRLGQTPTVDQGWWKRQQVLCDSATTPAGTDTATTTSITNTIAAVPETMLLFVARTVEFVSLVGQEESGKQQRYREQQRAQMQRGTIATSNISGSPSGDSSTSPPPVMLPSSGQPSTPFPLQVLMLIPSPIVQAYLWPVHNCLLSLWIAIILVLTLISGAWRSLQTLVWGARRTGIALRSVWQSEIQGTTQAIHALCQPYQALSCRLVGLVLLPISTIVNILQGLLGGSSITLASMGFTMVMMATWWYWILVLPWLAMCLLGIALMSGACFALIEFAGV